MKLSEITDKHEWRNKRVFVRLIGSRNKTTYYTGVVEDWSPKGAAFVKPEHSGPLHFPKWIEAEKLRVVV